VEGAEGGTSEASTGAKRTPEQARRQQGWIVGRWCRNAQKKIKNFSLYLQNKYTQILMLKSKLLILVLLFTSFAQAQVIPFGLMMNEKGKLQQVEGINYRGYIVDTIYLEYNNNFEFGDVGNFIQSFLIFMEPPGDYSRYPTNLDPSRIYDTSYVEEIPFNSNQYYPYLYNPISTATFFVDTISYFLDSVQNSPNPTFIPHYDEWVGLNITDSNLVQIKSILRDYVTELWGKNDRDDKRWELHQILSEPDSIVEHIYVFDYVVDRAVFYNYKDTFLQSILGYHWNYNVEIDSMRYDRKGNIIYYARETPGVFRHELYFKYDRHRRIISVDKVYLSWVDQNKEFYEESIRESYQYKYNKQGKISEIKVIQKDQDPTTIKVYWNTPPNNSLFKTHVSIFSID